MESGVVNRVPARDRSARSPTWRSIAASVQSAHRYARTMTSAALSTACTPNISPVARRRRVRLGIFGTISAVAVGAVFVAYDLPWTWRALGVFLPTVIAATGWLQARRHTCIARAHEGTFENDDRTTTKMSEEDVAASRNVAAGIRRDVLLIGAIVAALSAATALLPGMP
jgi:hypothetical protein